MYKFAFYKILAYALGVLLSGLGVIALLYSTYGAGSWDAVNYHMTLILGMSLGTASLITNLTILTIIIIFNKSFSYLITLIPIFTIALSIDFWDIFIFSQLSFSSTLHFIALFLFGVLILPLGLSCMIATKFPSMVYDELTFVLMRLSKVHSFLYVRWFVEGFAIVLAVVLGYIAGVGFGSVHVGSVIIAVIIGPLITFYLNMIKKITHKL